MMILGDINTSMFVTKNNPFIYITKKNLSREMVYYTHSQNSLFIKKYSETGNLAMVEETRLSTENKQLCKQ